MLASAKKVEPAEGHESLGLECRNATGLTLSLWLPP